MTKTHRPTSRDDRIAADQKLAAGIQANAALLPPSFTVRGQTFTQANVVSLCNDRITVAKAAQVADEAHAAASKADRDKRTQTTSTLGAIKRILIIMFANKPDLLGTFGLTPPPTEKASAPTKKAEANRKATATRAAHKAAKQAPPPPAKQA